MRAARFTGEALAFNQEFVDSGEIRSDRMLGDPAKVFAASQGSINFEMSYPVDNSPESDFLRSAFYNTWTNAPAFDNDGTADSVITDAGTTANTYVVTSGGASVKLGHLVRATNFTNAANNQIFRAASSTSTTIVGTALSLTAEIAPPATARLKVVGFAGASGDITATSTGLGSTALDFTTLGLVPGMWLKVGGTAAGDKFANIPANNDWVRISGTITATAIPLDNRPSGWAVDNGSGKTIKVWFGDYINNGTTQTSLTVERGFLDQTTPTYIVNTGMVVQSYDITLTKKQIITGVVSFTGMGGSESTTALDASVDAVTTGQVMAGSANVGRIAEAGSQLTSPNWVNELKLTINNNNRQLEAVDNTSPVGINSGECTVTLNINAYFGSDALLAKFYAGTATAINARVAKNSQALIWQFPRVTLKGGGNPQATGKNTDTMQAFDASANIDTTLTSKQIQLDRVEYFET
jgi:putative NIF3 family GTP cyclohydrolase 1 type 2